MVLPKTNLTFGILTLAKLMVVGDYKRRNRLKPIREES
jgi:hypothetical protein